MNMQNATLIESGDAEETGFNGLTATDFLKKLNMTKPKIYCFSNAIGGGRGMAYAIAEDGTILGSHDCSDERYVIGDLAVNKESYPKRHEAYEKHYPNGYEMEFVHAKDVRTHEGLCRAIELIPIQKQKQINAMTVKELRDAMLKDGEYALGFSGCFNSGYSGPAWIHKDGQRTSFPRDDADLMREYLLIKLAGGLGIQ